MISRISPGSRCETTWEARSRGRSRNASVRSSGSSAKSASTMSGASSWANSDRTASQFPAAICSCRFAIAKVGVGTTGSFRQGEASPFTKGTGAYALSDPGFGSWAAALRGLVLGKSVGTGLAPAEACVRWEDRRRHYGPEARPIRRESAVSSLELSLPRIKTLGRAREIRGCPLEGVASRARGR